MVVMEEKAEMTSVRLLAIILKGPVATAAMVVSVDTPAQPVPTALNWISTM
jgi:hypothetical protein